MGLHTQKKIQVGVVREIWLAAGRGTWLVCQGPNAPISATSKPAPEIIRLAVMLGCFTEIESGKNPDRPELAKSLHLAKVTGSTLIIAKLDRLSRSAAFLLTLRDSGVRFLACDMPEANDLTVGITALVPQAEREAISRRTKEALAVAKPRGVKPGNPNGIEPFSAPEQGTVALRATVWAIPNALPPISPRLSPILGAAAHPSLRAIAVEPNARGMMTVALGGVENLKGVLGRVVAKVAR